MAISNSILFVYNPAASRGTGHAEIEDIRKAIGSRHDWAETTGPGDALRISREAIANGYRTIVAVGGDGTFHEIVNGIMSVNHESRPSLGIIPTGSGNDFAFGAGIPLDLASALDVILRARTKPVDIGSLENNRGNRVFWDNSVGIGFDAKVTINSARYTSMLGSSGIHGFPLYLLATLHTLLREHEALDIEMTVDSHRFSEKALMLTLANGPREGGGFYTTPHSKPDDGIFEMLLIKPLTRLQMLALLPRVMSGKHLASSSVFTRSFTTFNLQSKQPLTIHLDGEIYSMPADNVRNIAIRIKHNAIDLLC